MRTSFINTLCDIAENDSKINLIVGDLGYSVVEVFAERFTSRYLNVGIMEQCMLGTAAGMALESNSKVFVYSIANFPVIRPLEQIRNDVCYHHADVKVVAVGGGLAYGSQGYSHFAVEDLAIMRTMPGMVVVAPADPVETEAVVRLACQIPGPWYIRLGKNREPVIHLNGLDDFGLGKAVFLKDGKDGAIIATGSIVSEAAKAADILKKKNGLDICLISMPFVKPIDVEAINNICQRVPWVMTVEEHNGYGGLGSAVAEVMSQQANGVKLHRVFLPENHETIGSQQYLRNLYGIDAEGITQKVAEILL